MKSWKRMLHLMKVRRMEVFISILLIAGIISSIKVEMEQERMGNLLRVRAEKEAERDKLAEMSTKYPDYRDLLYRLAAMEWELGNDEAAKAALARVEYLDPNNEGLKILNELMSKGLAD